MNTRHRIEIALVAMVTLGVWVVASCAHRSRTAPAQDTLAIGEAPGAVPVVSPPTTTRQSRSNPRPIGGNTIAPIPAPGDDSAAAEQRKTLNLPKFGDYVFVTHLPEVIERIAPVYPEIARRADVSGTVLVHALVLPDGTVGDTRIGNSIPLLDESALICVRQWRFKPARNNEGPTAVWVAVPVTYTLEP